MTINSKIKINMDALKSRREWRRHKVKDGHNIFRILPPFGESSNGYPFRKWQVIWGLADPESGRVRPFPSSLTTEKRCPISEFVTELSKRADEMKAQLIASGFTEDDVKERLTALNKLISDIKPKTVYVYNAADKAGEVGLLELKSTAHKDMKKEMMQYVQDYNQDPTSLGSADDDSGVWFDITRSGLGRDTEYGVKKCQVKVKTGNTFSFMDDRSALPQNVVDNYENLAYDLGATYQVKTYEQLQEILAANMPAIIEAVPDADLSVDFSLEASPVVAVSQKPVATKTAPVSTSMPSKLGKAVALNLTEDEEDDEVQARPVHSTPAKPRYAAPVAPNKVGQKVAASAQSATVASTVSDDEDFQAMADAILNG